jgi:ABC-type nitrate/sulfonate/bicarbonate transport system substrate-binding protein
MFHRETADARFGISPYQDTAIPVIADSEGFFAQQNVKATLKTIPWENIVPALASSNRPVDLAIGSINTLLPRATAVNENNSDPVVFFAPLYVFKGASLVARKGSRLTPYKTLLADSGGNQAAALRRMVTELKGKRIGFPSGTPYEQMFLQIMRIGNGDRSTLDIRDVQLADGLPALLSGSLDLAGAGVTQRTEALRQGHYLLIETEDLGFAEIVGLVTTRSFVTGHKKELEAIRRAWFESIRLLKSDPKRASASVLTYLAQNASTKYSFEEYMASLGAQEFPTTEAEAAQLFQSPSGRFYWKQTWDIVNNYLLETHKISKPVPYEYYFQSSN